MYAALYFVEIKVIYRLELLCFFSKQLKLDNFGVFLQSRWAS